MTTVRYALIGTGSRAQMYLDAITGPHADTAELVAWSDTNPGRLDHYERYLSDLGAGAGAREIDTTDDKNAGVRGSAGVPHRFPAYELADAIASLSIDRVIVTTPDFTHAGYIATALDAGADVVVEKPLTVSVDGVRQINQAVARSGGNVIVTFNYRYSPRNSALKQVITGGEIGQVTSVHFEWLLDTAHGADYFRRWHRIKACSGGLLVHKATHHFDLVNWWLDDTPTRVFASGGLRFYGAENARRRGLGQRPDRGTTDDPASDAFSLDLRLHPDLKALYLDQEAHDGYLRDRDVFDEGIDIEDNLSLVVDYASGASMSYGLSAHGPWEGYTVYVNGTKGRAELSVVERSAVIVGDDGKIAIVDPSARADKAAGEQVRLPDERLVVQEQFGLAREVPIPEGSGGHGGGDDILLSHVFRGVDDDPLGRVADWRDGVRSVAVGLAGNLSLQSGQAVWLNDLDLGSVDAGSVDAGSVDADAGSGSGK